MFDVLEADIVCFQETKIQQKDLTDDMVIVPGWDSYFTFPKHKKGCRTFLYHIAAILMILRYLTMLRL